jgi:hypothetical protein
VEFLLWSLSMALVLCFGNGEFKIEEVVLLVIQGL